VEFIKQNALLIGLAIGSGLMLLLPSLKKSTGGVPNVAPSEAVNLINRANAVVLDVRDDTEYATGHIPDAVHIPVADLEARIGELKKYANKPVLVHCQSGVRSGKACEILRKAEFTQLHHLQGGLNAWVGAKLPIVAGKVKQAARKAKPAAAAANDENVQETEKS